MRTVAWFAFALVCVLFAVMNLGCAMMQAAKEWVPPWGPGIEKPDDNPSGLPVPVSELVDCSRPGVVHPKDLTQVWTLSNIRRGPGDAVLWDCDATGDCVLAFAVERDGVWCWAVTEWLPNGQSYQSWKNSLEEVRHNGKDMWNGPLNGFVFQSGDVLYLQVNSKNWGLYGSDGRNLCSNFAEWTYP